ncbi:MAG TPA: lantibiotic dehydratase [Longimicrobium sp.]
MTTLAPPAPETQTDTEPLAEGGGLFPHFVCRLSGLPVDAVESLRAPRCEALLERLRDVEQALAAAREPVSALLFEAVRAEESPETRKQLVNLRRDLFNLRPARPAALEAARTALSPDAQAGVEAFAARLDERGRVLGELRARYAEETRAARTRFRALLGEEDFQKGLLLSSPALHTAQARYLESDAGRPGGKAEKTERGLLRYFTRTAMKATPFGTLCAIVPGEVVPAAPGERGARLRLGGDPRRKRSSTRLNKQICGVITRWVKANPALRPFLEVELNPTLSDEGEEMAFLAVHREREVFQRIEKNPVLELVADELAARPRVSLSELARALAASPAVDAGEDVALAYLEKLAEAGFLRFRLGIREQDADWDLPLRALLERTGDPGALRLAALLGTLRERAGRYDAAGPEERIRLLADTRAELEEARAALKLRGPGFAANLPFLEDSTADVPVTLARTPEVRALEETLAGLVRLARRVAANRGEQAEMRHWFEAHYGPDAAPVPLLAFFEDFSREHLKPHALLQRRGDPGELPAGYRPSNPFGLPFIDGLRRAERALSDLVSARWAAAPGAEEVALSRGDLEAVLGGVPAMSPDPASAAAFAELVGADAGGTARLILTKSAFGMGFGKFFSRFLPLFPARVQRDLQEANRGPADGFMAEICGDGNHNANLHPPLVAREISYPTGESGVAEEQVPSTDIVVAPHPADPRALCLVHAPTGERVVPVDLGIVNPGSRPPLYQLLSRFTPPVELYLRLPEHPFHLAGILRDPALEPAGPAERAAREAAEREALDRYLTSVTHAPRIVYEGCIVLRRRQWVVPASLLPRQGADEAPLDFFLRVDRWRREHGIPREVYASIQPLLVLPGGGGGMDEVNGRPVPRRVSRASLNHRKPQYVDFASPLLVGLFGHFAPDDGDAYSVLLAERLPGGDELPEFEGRRYAAEQIIQVNLSHAPGE